MVTTIQLDEKLKKKLDNLKVHHRETYNDIISRLVEGSSPKNSHRESLIETIEVLSDPRAMRSLAEAVERFNKGEKGVKFEDLKKELRLNV